MHDLSIEAITSRCESERALTIGRPADYEDKFVVFAKSGIHARVAGGIVTGFDRATPTDHLMMPGGLLAASLATLPADRAGLAPLLVDILDPCIALQLEGAAHA